MAKGVYSVDEAAEKLGIGRNSAYRAVQSGDIPSIKIGRLLRIPKAAIDRLLGASDAQETPSPTQEARREIPKVNALKVTRRPQQPRIQVNLVITVELNNKLVRAAEARGQTLSGEIRDRLIRSIEEDEREGR